MSLDQASPGTAKLAAPIRFNNLINDFNSSIQDLDSLKSRLEESAYRLSGIRPIDHAPTNIETAVEPEDVAGRLQSRLNELNSLISQLSQITGLMDEQV